MRFLYALSIRFYGLLLGLIAPFHPKAKRFVEGRKDLINRIRQTVEPGAKHLWFHFASLGEFEQGRAVLEEIKNNFPAYKIVLTFYSPSGYEVRKNTALADYVFYLPLDTKQHARDFLSIIQPAFAVFTKYEYWHYYFVEMNKRAIPIFVISAIFRKDQIYFKWYGGFFRNILKQVQYFFVQNTESLFLLKSLGLTNAGLTGDTRFDRVLALAKSPKDLPLISSFINHSPCLVIGSSWPEDEQLLADLQSKYAAWKWIIAPHEIHAEHLDTIAEKFAAVIRYSALQQGQPCAAQVLLIDNIGLLSSLYAYADVAYIGGGFGAGIHNTLEAATYGIPVIFGPKYQKFQEAKDLIEVGAGFSIHSASELEAVFAHLQVVEKRLFAGESAANYVRANAGATAIIMRYLKGYLSY